MKASFYVLPTTILALYFRKLYRSPKTFSTVHLLWRKRKEKWMVSLLGLLSSMYMGAEFFPKIKQQQRQQKLFIVIVRSLHRLVRIHRGFEKLRFRFLQPGIPVTDCSSFSVFLGQCHKSSVFGVRCSGEDREWNRSFFCNVISLCIIELRYEDPRKCSHCYRRSTRNREAYLQSALVKRW